MGQRLAERAEMGDVLEQPLHLFIDGNAITTAVRRRAVDHDAAKALHSLDISGEISTKVPKRRVRISDDTFHEGTR